MARRILSMDVGLRNLGVALVKWAPDMPCAHVELMECCDILTDCGSAAKCNRVPKVDMIRHVANFLVTKEEHWGACNITDFVVEGQVRKAPRNVNIMVSLFTWFHQLHKRTQLLSPEHKPGTVFQVSARNKLADESAVATHYQRKKQAIEKLKHCVATKSVTVDPSTHVRYSLAKKQDDMADAVLQALWYIDAKILGKIPSSKVDKRKQAVGKAKGKGKGKKEKTTVEGEPKETKRGSGKGKGKGKEKTTVEGEPKETKRGVGKGKGKGKGKK